MFAVVWPEASVSSGVFWFCVQCFVFSVIFVSDVFLISRSNVIY